MEYTKLDTIKAKLEPPKATKVDNNGPDHKTPIDDNDNQDDDGHYIG